MILVTTWLTGMTLDHDFANSFTFSSSLFFRREEILGKDPKPIDQVR